MKIKRIELHGFRTFPQLDLELSDYSVFVGKNNSGKSNLLHAIYCFYNPKKLTMDDATKNVTGDYQYHDLSIKLTYDDLNPTEKQNNKLYYYNNQVIVELIAQILDEGENPFPKIKPKYHGYLQDFDFEYDDTLDPEIKALFLDDKTPKKREVRPLGRLGEIADELCTRAISTEKWMEIKSKFTDESPLISKIPKLVRSPTEYQGFIGTSDLSICGKCMFIPAIMNPIDDLDESTKKSKISELVTSLMNECISQPTQDQFKELIDQLNADREITRQNIVSRFDKELEIWKTTTDLMLLKPTLEDSIPLGFELMFNDGISTKLVQKGAGLQRYVFFKFLKIFNELKHTSQISLILLFEEPESHLHPHFQREIEEIIRMLVNDHTHSYQIIMTTHSAQFIDLTNMKYLYRFTRNDNFCTDTENCFLDFSKTHDRTRMQMLSMLNPYIREIFFADKVILVEGGSEVQFFQYLKNEGEIDLKNISIVEMGSKNNYKYFVPVLNSIKMPYCIIVDEDPYWEPHYQIKNPDSFSSKKRVYQLNNTILNKIDPHFGRVCIISPDFDTYIGTSKSQLDDKGKPFATMRRMFEINKSTDPKIAKYKKNIEKLIEDISHFESWSERARIYPVGSAWALKDEKTVTMTTIDVAYVSQKILDKITVWKGIVQQFAPAQMTSLISEIRLQIGKIFLVKKRKSTKKRSKKTKKRSKNKQESLKLFIGDNSEK